MDNKTIKLNVKLRAYTKLNLENNNGFEDAPQDGNQYVRQDGEWKVVQNTLDEEAIKELIKSEQEFEYILDNRPEIVFNGGTAFSDENEEYINIARGGNATMVDEQFKIICKPMNAKGEYNE